MKERVRKLGLLPGLRNVLEYVVKEDCCKKRWMKFGDGRLERSEEIFTMIRKVC